MKWFVLPTQLEDGASNGKVLLAIACMMAVVFGIVFALWGASYIPEVIQPRWFGVIVCIAAMTGLSCLFAYIMVPNNKTRPNHKKEG